MKIVVSENHQISSALLAKKVVEYLKNKPKSLLCFAGGFSPLETYSILVEAQKSGKVDFSETTFVLLDEWVGISGETYGSCIQTLKDALYDKLDLDNERQVIAFNGLASDLKIESKRVKDAIDNLGGIDISILGIGMNGHLGFNEPGCDQFMSVGVVKLDDITTRVGQKYFIEPVALEYGLTIGLNYLMKSKFIAMIANGSDKKDIVYKTIHNPISTQIPSTLVRSHEDSALFITQSIY